VTLECLFVPKDRFEHLVADGDLGSTLMALGGSETKGQVGSALRAVVPMVLLHVPVLPRLAHLLYFLGFCAILFIEIRFAPEAANLRQGGVVFDALILLDGEAEEV